MKKIVEPNWRMTLVQRPAYVQDAIHSLNASCMQIVLVIDEHGVLQGTITDGDIRRGLLRGMNLNDDVGSIMFTTPLVAPPEINRETVLHLMRANDLLQLPVVDAQRRVIGLHFWKDMIVPPQRDALMVVMAGGMGTRLRPYTEDCPKPMLPVGGKPMLEHILERAKAEGFRNFSFSVRYLAHMIEDYFGDGAQWDVRISYLSEETPLGTAGSLRLLDPAPDGPVVVTNGDVLTDIRYGEMLDFHLHHKAKATMAVRTYEWQNPFGVVHMQGVDIVGLEEKPLVRSHVNAGIYVLSQDALYCIPQGQSYDMPDVFEQLRHKGSKIIAYPMHEVWMDIGRPDDLEQARKLTAIREERLNTGETQ